MHKYVNSYRFAASGGAWLPTSESSLQWWYNSNRSTLWTTDTGTTAPSSDGDDVGYWEDLSGNGYHLVQPTASACPHYITNQLNSKPIVRFDGVDDVLWHLSLDHTGSNAFEDICLCVVFFFQSAKNYGRVVSLNPATGGANDNNNDDGMIACFGNSGTAGNKPGSWRYGSAAQAFSADTLTSFGFFRMHADIANGNDLEIFVDEVSKGTDTTWSGHSGGMQPTRLFIGDRPDSARPAEVDIADIFAFNVDADTTLINNITSYISSEWGL